MIGAVLVSNFEVSGIIFSNAKFEFLLGPYIVRVADSPARELKNSKNGWNSINTKPISEALQKNRAGFKI